MRRILILLALAAPSAFAADDINHGDTAWLLTSTALVLMMTVPGLALFYAGLVRARNVVSVCAQCFAIACLASLLWVICGYSLTFIGDGPFIGDFSKAFMAGIGPESVRGSIPESVFAAFQMTFAIITPVLVVGAYVERIRFGATLLFSGLWLLLVYVPVAHWIWGGGWLAEKGVWDFAGGIVVHTTAGIAALVIAMKLGKRRDFNNVFHPPHSPVLTGIGACLLWVGWFGFNAGSALAADGSAGIALLTTHTAATAGALTWIWLEWHKTRKINLITMTTGLIAGLATITPAAGYVGLPAALFLGIVGGLLCYFIVPLIRTRLSIDDSLDVFAVHGVGGIAGSLLVAVFGNPESIAAQFGAQLLGVTVTAIWTAIVTFLILLAVKKIIPLRVSEESEASGLDLSEHGEMGYHFD